MPERGKFLIGEIRIFAWHKKAAYDKIHDRLWQIAWPAYRQRPELEVKTLNGKYLDIHLKIPAVYKTREQEIRGLLGQKLKRGKVELIISINSLDETSNYALNKGLMEKYYQELTDFAREQGTTVSGDLIPAILRLPDIVQQDAQTLDEEEWEAVSTAIQEAVEDCNAYREEEGRHLADDLDLRIRNISHFCQKSRTWMLPARKTSSKS